MIISGNSTGILPIARQLPASYMEPLRFSFDLEINGLGNNVEFGLSTASNTPIISYNLKSGLVYDYSGRFVGTYQSGTNLFQYSYYSGESQQYINNRLVSAGDPLLNYSGNPFERFYLKNKSNSPVDFDLNIRGFVPPAIYSNLVLNGSTLSGEIIQSGLDVYTGQAILYQVFNISVPTGYGTVTYQQSGTGGIKYSISGGTYSPDQEIPIQFNTYWGSFNQTLVVGGSLTGDPATSETGVYLNLYGSENVVLTNQSLDFYLDFYSNAAFPVTVEFSGSGNSTLTTLSGSGEGFITYQGNVFGSGVIFSDGIATGIADLLASPNLAYNTEYTILDRYLNISNKITGLYGKQTPFIGTYAVNYTGIELVGTYDGPNQSLMGKEWKATGDVSVDYIFTPYDGGVLVDAASYPGKANPAYSNGKFMIKNGSNYIEYPYNAATYPTGEGYGYIEATVTGQGIVTITEDVDFFGYGLGRVASGSTYVPGTGTGIANYTGNVNDWIHYADYRFTYPDYPVYPEIEVDPDTIASGGAIVVVQKENYIGKTQSNGKIVTITGVPTSSSVTWGYPTGPTIISIPSNSVQIVKYFEIPSLSFTAISGTPVTMGYTGEATGYFEGPEIRVGGPIFPDPRDTGLYPYGGAGGLSPIGPVFYGRGCIFGQLGFSYASLGMAAPDNVPVTFEIKTGGYIAILEETFSDVNTQLRSFGNFYPIRDGEGGYGLEFLQDRLNVQVSGQTFTGWAKIGTDGIEEIFRFEEGRDEEDTLIDYAANGWIFGNTFRRPTPETFGPGSSGKYYKISYISTDENSQDTATLRAYTAGTTGFIEITGNPI